MTRPRDDKIDGHSSMWRDQESHMTVLENRIAERDQIYKTGGERFLARMARITSRPLDVVLPMGAEQGERRVKRKERKQSKKGYALEGSDA